MSQKPFGRAAFTARAAADATAHENTKPIQTPFETQGILYYSVQMSYMKVLKDASSSSSAVENFPWGREGAEFWETHKFDA